MRAQRLSYQAAGAAVAPRAEPLATARAASLTLVAPLVEREPQYGGTASQARQRRIIVTTLLAAHALGVVGLLNASRLREVAIDAKPIFLAVVDAPAPVAPPKPLPPPPTARIPPPPQLTLPLIAPEPSPSPSPLLAVAQVPPPPPTAVAPVEAPPAPAPSLPRTIPPSAVQYITPPSPVYSRISAKMRESGKAVIRVYIDEAGLPRNVQLATSTGFARLDDSALAAVRNCRFKPYLENGVAVAGWALIPIEFELPT